MAKSPFSRRDAQYDLTRRSLVKWTLAAGVGLGVSRTKVLEILEKHAGSGIAQAAGLQGARVVFHEEGSGGMSNMTQIMGHARHAGTMTNQPWLGGNNGQPGTLMAGTDKPYMTYDGDPVAFLGPKKVWSAFMCGDDRTHNNDGNNSAFAINGKALAAFAAEEAAGNVANILPALSIGVNVGASDVPFSTAANAAGAVNLFNSVASQTGGLLFAPAGAANVNAELFAAHYDILSSLNKVARDPIQAASYKTARDAARFIARNLAAALTVTPAEMAEYGTAGSNAVARVRQNLAFAHKAYALGLTNVVAFAGCRNDPHGVWDSGAAPTEFPALRRAIGTFFQKMASTDDPTGSGKLIDNFVYVCTGDTLKSDTNRAGWPDGSRNDSHMMLVYGGGYIKTGWHGQMLANSVTSASDNGGEMAYNGINALGKAMACAAFAMCKGDERRAQRLVGGNVVYKQMINTAIL